METGNRQPWQPSGKAAGGLPLVSIVINNYNYGRFLTAAVSSALHQTYRSIEIIVVDDGSTDDSRAVMHSFGAEIKSIFKTNGGQGSAYNAGFQASTGEFIHFLDSDDMLQPSAIEEAMRVWEPGVAKVHFYLRVMGTDGKPTDSLFPACRLAEGDVKDEIVKTGWYASPPASGNLYWRPALERIFPMPEAEWVGAADTYPIFLTPLSGEVRACRNALGLYRVHGGNKDAQTKMTTQLLAYKLKKEALRDALLSKFYTSEGVVYSPGAVRNHIGHMKLRFASLALYPSRHPYPNDRLFSTARQTGAICWTKTDWPILKKLLFTLWVAYVLCAPASQKFNAIDVAFAPTRRSKLMQRWTSRFKSHAEPATA